MKAPNANRSTQSRQPLGLIGVALLLVASAAFTCAAATVVTADGQSYEGEVSLGPGNFVTAILDDGAKKSFALDTIQAATFTSAQLNLSQFGTLAEGWTNVDVGEVSIAGMAGQSNRTVAIRAAGGDIGAERDSFHFVHFRAFRDVDVFARIVAIDGADRLARAGVMLRDSLRPEAKFAFVAVSGTGELSVQQRSNTGGKAGARGGTPLSTGEMALPRWLKISRRDKTIRTYQSSNGQHWQEISSETLSLKDIYYAGVAVAAHGTLSICTALVDDLSRTVPGVFAEYFSDDSFAKLKATRIDPHLNFQWGATPPVAGLMPHKFSVRWTAELEPKHSENYTFYYDAEDAQLWVNGQLLPHLPLTRRGASDRENPTPLPLLLKANNRYPLRFEYRRVRSGPPVRVGWSSPSQTKEAIPEGRLFCTTRAQAEPGRPTALTTTNSWIMGRGIMLRDGSFITGVVRSMDDDAVRFAYRENEEYTVAAHHVARLVFRVGPRNAVLSDRGLSEGALLTNGDFMEGQVFLPNARTVKISSVLFGMRSYHLENGDLAAVVLGAPDAVRPRYEIRLSDNSVLLASSINVDQDQVALVQPVIGAMRVARDAITEIRATRTATIAPVPGRVASPAETGP